jgi:UDP-N-acetylglucosamine 2-epimerase (non-hydrolysing)
MKTILIAFGTRPEVIKLAPVIKQLGDGFKVRVMHTGQHQDLVEPLLSIFDIQPDIELNIMQPGQDLFDLTQSLLPKLKVQLQFLKPDIVMVQGDTSTSYLTALAAYYLQIPVVHVEAGLRSHNPYYPFPEEMNRKQISHLARLHFAPTKRNKQNLLNEGIPDKNITITGNTVVDALRFIENTSGFEQIRPNILDQISSSDKLVLLTAHRRENHGQPLQNIFAAVKQLLAQHLGLKVIFPAHPNPNVQAAIEKSNITNSRFLKIAPVDYLPFLHILKRADLILSDSGGIQEEAAALGKPILVLREQTERQELIEAGLGVLVGANVQAILKEANAFLSNTDRITPTSIFGDGNAALKIKEALVGQL